MDISILNKLVLFSSNGYQNSKLEKLINASTNQLYLRRITFSELNNIVDRENDKGQVKADFLVKSNNVEFKKGAQNDYIQIYDPDINFKEFGLSTQFIIKLDGASNPENNVCCCLVDSTVFSAVMVLASYIAGCAVCLFYYY